MEVRTGAEYSPEDYFTLLEEKYGTLARSEYFISDARIAHAYASRSESIAFTPIALYEDGVLVAHVALIVDDRRPKGEAFFGFFESPDKREVLDALWNELCTRARSAGVTKLLGPISGSIWHQYRSVKESDGSAFFTAEPMAEECYYNFLKSKDPQKEIGYLSASRSDFGIVLRLLGAAAYSRIALSGFSIRKAEKVGPDEMRAIAELSKEAFSSSWGYTELSESEFLALYTPQKICAHLSALYLLCKGEEIIGFLSTAREDGTTLICKTICIKPTYQGKGLGNALAYKMHADALQEGVTRVIYALIREGNGVGKFPKDGIDIFRRYAAFEYDI